MNGEPPKPNGRHCPDHGRFDERFKHIKCDMKELRKTDDSQWGEINYMKRLFVWVAIMVALTMIGVAANLMIAIAKGEGAMIAWDAVPNHVFTRAEFDDPNHPGSGDYLDPEVFHELLSIRLATGWPMIVHGAVGGAVDVDGSWGHASGSRHLVEKGACALDWHFITGASAREQARIVLSAGFGGIGIYHDWKWNGAPLPIGFHTDTRDKFQVWTRREGQYLYLL